MSYGRLNLLRLIVIAGLLTTAPLASATSQRTFVASTGNDANPCTLALPCRAFAAAVAQTNAGGEVIVADSAGYGPVIITKSISIIAPPGVYAGITVPSGGQGIRVESIAVVVRGLTINGGGSGVGIFAPQASNLTIEDCEIANLDIGIDVAGGYNVVTVRHTVVRDVLYGFSTVSSVDATLDGVHIFAHNIGVEAATIASSSIERLTLANCVITMSAGGSGVFAWANTGSVAEIMVTHSTISGGDKGIVVSALFASTARIVSDGNAINNTATAAFFFVGNAGTEVINTSGTNTVGFTPAIVLGGALTPIGQH